MSRRSTYGICKEKGCGTVGTRPSDVPNHGVCQAHAAQQILSDLITELRDFPLLPRTGVSVDEARSMLSGLHFAKEALSDGERKLLYIAEGLLRLIDEGDLATTRAQARLHELEANK